MGNQQDRFRYDAAIKDLFQTDRPSLLDVWTRGVPVRESLNVEFAIVQERVADLVLLLHDETILHIDFQSANHPKMAHRVGIYGLMIHEKYDRKVRQIVLYTGQPRLTMANSLNIGDTTVGYTLIDIRDLDVESFLASGRPGDYALALLASGGVEKMTEILNAANRLDSYERRRALTQMAILSGLRGASERLRMELKRMGLTIDIETHAFFREIRENAKAEGVTEGMAHGMAALIHGMIAARFGAVPEWAAARIATSSTAQLQQVANKLTGAATLEAAFDPSA